MDVTPAFDMTDQFNSGQADHNIETSKSVADIRESGNNNDARNALRRNTMQKTHKVSHITEQIWH